MTLNRGGAVLELSCTKGDTVEVIEVDDSERFHVVLMMFINEMRTQALLLRHMEDGTKFDPEYIHLYDRDE